MVRLAHILSMVGVVLMAVAIPRELSEPDVWTFLIVVGFFSMFVGTITVMLGADS